MGLKMIKVFSIPEDNKFLCYDLTERLDALMLIYGSFLLSAMNAAEEHKVRVEMECIAHIAAKCNIITNFEFREICCTIWRGHNWSFDTWYSINYGTNDLCKFIP